MLSPSLPSSASPNNSFFCTERPTFVNTATYYEFLEGDVAVVPCIVTGQPQVEVKWKKNMAESNVTTDSDGKWVFQL